MTHWVFTAEQCDRAIDAFVGRLKRGKTLVRNDETADKLGEMIKVFLHSPEAHAYKLMGGASYRATPVPRGTEPGKSSDGQ